MNKQICPVCQTEQEEFDKHHVVWKSEGGSETRLISSGYVNHVTPC